MIITHRGHTPRIDPTASVADTAIVSGDVEIGPGVRVLHGAVITAEDGHIRIGENTLVMECALIRARKGHDVSIGHSNLIGAHAHVNGARTGHSCFIATGAAIFPGARLGDGAEVRVRAVVQVNTHLDDGAIVPIHWVAVGTPAAILPPGRHEEIWAIQRDLDFPGTVYGVERGTPMADLMASQSEWYSAHDEDEVVT